jgi:hypothetical protein
MKRIQKLNKLKGYIWFGLPSRYFGFGAFDIIFTASPAVSVPTAISWLGLRYEREIYEESKKEPQRKTQRNLS